jgi:hypothetical protein
MQKVDPVEAIREIHKHLTETLGYLPRVDFLGACAQTLLDIVDNPKLSEAGRNADFTPISLVNMPYGNGNKYRILGIKVQDNKVPLALQTDWLRARLLLTEDQFESDR